jgi:glycosyltransferase involved in cell wall biosynthesis
MACKLPCVATDVGGNKELLIQRETGLLVPPDNCEELAIALTRLLGDRNLARDMGLRAEQAVLSRFTTEVMMNNLISIYQELIAAKESR